MIKINRATPDKHKYLMPLSSISTPPKTIFFRGTLPEKRIPTVAIIGTRKPTSYGKVELASQGVAVVSGLALGIDAISHKAALEAGGLTLAVLANSVDTIYPRSHTNLAEQIIQQGGAILSEYEPPRDARGYQFLARNRIVSGLADAVVIVEAAKRSGTLSTAAHALEQGREVFAVPGNITSPLSAGCNSLLAHGAHPVTQTRDILDIIMPGHSSTQATLPLGSTPLETNIIKLVQMGIRDGDELLRESGAEVREFTEALTMLELNGSIRSLGANQWTLY